MGLIFLLLAGAALSLPGCSKQGEGERCSPIANGNEDCEEGLVCTADKAVADFGRCCPPEGAEVSDSRCNPSSTPVATGGTNGGGMSGGGGTSGGGSNNGGSSGGAGTPDPGEGGSGAAPNAGAGGNDDPVATGGSSGAGGA